MSFELTFCFSPLCSILARITINLHNCYQTTVEKMLLRSSKRVAADMGDNIDAPRKKAKNIVVAEPLKVTDLNDDCLEDIFRHLDITQLTNVANSHPRFVNAARMVYKVKNSNKTLCIRDSGNTITLTDDANCFEEVRATPTVFLQNFGHLTKSLQLDYYSEDGYYSGDISNEHHWREIEDLVFKYCRKTLITLKLKHCSNDVMEEIRGEFENVERLTIVNCTFSNRNAIRFSKWFPKITRLKLKEVYIDETNAFNGKFRSLEKLIIFLDDVDDEYYSICDILRSNRHIKHLSINFDYGTRSDFLQIFLMFLSETLQQLEVLRLHNARVDLLELQNRIYFKNVKEFSLNGKRLVNSNISFEVSKYRWAN